MELNLGCLREGFVTKKIEDEAAGSVFVQIEDIRTPMKEQDFGYTVDFSKVFPILERKEK